MKPTLDRIRLRSNYPGLFFSWAVTAPLRDRTGLESHPSVKDATSATGDAHRPFGPRPSYRYHRPLPPTVAADRYHYC